MRILLVLFVVVMTVVAGLTSLLMAGDILPGGRGNGGVPAFTAVAGDILPGENGKLPGCLTIAGDILPGENGGIAVFHVAGDILPGENG